MCVIEFRKHPSKEDLGKHNTNIYFYTTDQNLAHLLIIRSSKQAIYKFFGQGDI